VYSTSAAWAAVHDQYVGRNTNIEGESSRGVLHELHAGQAVPTTRTRLKLSHGPTDRWLGIQHVEGEGTREEQRVHH